MSNVQLKGDDPRHPWWVIEGTPGEIVQQIAQVFPDLRVTDPGEFPSAVAKAREAWAAQMSVATGLGGTEVRQEVPAREFQQRQEQPQREMATGARTPVVERDNWGNTYEIGRPDAKMTQYGPAVLKTGKSKTGNVYKRWIDPRDKAIPSVYAGGQHSNPADLWDGEFFSDRR